MLNTFRELFEKEIYRFETSSPDPVIIDCGSNIGLSILYFKKIFPSSTIISFEPDKENAKLLAKNIAENKLENVAANEAAIWRENGFVNFEANASEGSSIINTLKKGNTVISVPAIRLSDVLKKYEKIDFLKIDIEGAEGAVIDDCGELLGRASHIFLEYHGRKSETEKLTSILAVLKSCGFSIYISNATTALAQPFYHQNSTGQFDVQLNIYCYLNNSGLSGK